MTEPQSGPRCSTAAGFGVEDLHSAFVHAPTGVAVLTPDGVVTGGNPALAQILGRDLTVLVGDTLFYVTHPEDLPAARASCAAIAAGEVTVSRHQCRFLRPDDTPVWVRVSTTRVEASGARPAHLIMHVEDISEQKALEARLVHQTLHDPLTGLGNQSLLRKRITADLVAAAVGRALVGPASGGPAPAGRVSALVVLDLDGFKALNDTLGHPAGDAALVEVARRLRSVAGPDALVARQGGDEFAVWSPDTTTDALVLLVAKLRVALLAPMTLDGVAAQLAASIGSAVHAHPAQIGAGPADDVPRDPQRADPVAALIRAADAAMYTDKRRAPPSPG